MAKIFILPKFSELPPPPNSKTQSNFNTLADAFVMALPPFQKELNDFSAAFEGQSSAVLDNIEAIKDAMGDEAEEIAKLYKKALSDIAAARAEALDTAEDKRRLLIDTANDSLSAMLAKKDEYLKDLDALEKELLKALAEAKDARLEEYYEMITKYKTDVFNSFKREIKALVDANRDDLVGIKGAFTDFTAAAEDIKAKGEAYLKEVVKKGQEGLGDTATKANEGLIATATKAHEDFNTSAKEVKDKLLALPTVDGFKDEVVEEIKKESGGLGGGLGVDGMLWVINQEALLLNAKLKSYV